MSLAGVELATLAGAHDFDGVGDHVGPVKTLPECIAIEGARCCVVTTHPGVDISNQLPALGEGNASLQKPRRAALL